MILIVVFTCLTVSPAIAQDTPSSPAETDSASVLPTDSLALDSLGADSLMADSLSGDSITVKSLPAGDNVSTTVNYSARDSIMMDVSGKKAYLFGKAHVDYGSIELDAEYIEIDWEKSEVFAHGMPDSTGTDTIGDPVFKENQDMYVAKEMRYNFKSKRGIIKRVITQEGEGYIHGDVVKMNANKELFVGGAVYTTCNLEHPHFAIHAKKIKIIPDKLAVTGPFHLEIGDVPTPIGGPFGLFPLPKEKASGFILPQYGEVASRGFFLRGLGYYWAINDYFGTAFTGDIYTNGSWRISNSTDYHHRYRFKGSIDLGLSKLKGGFDRNRDNGEENVPQTGYLIKWTHTPKQLRSSSLTSSVEIQSSNYGRENFFDVNRGLQNAFSSSVMYSKRFNNTPFRLNVAMRQTQRDTVQTYTLPDISFNMNRIQPFKGLSGSSSAWYKQIGIAYTLTGKNEITNQLEFVEINNVQVSLLDPELDIRRLVRSDREVIDGTISADIDFLEPAMLLESGKHGLKHNIPLTLPTFKLLKHFTLAPIINYTEYWYTSRLNYEFVDSLNAAVAREENGFNRLSEYSGNVSLTTRMYGYLEMPILGLRRIKHTATPKITFTYKPDFGLSQFDYYQSFTDTNSRTFQVSRYDGYAMGTPTRGEQQLLSFSLSNVFDGKFVDRKDTTGTKPFVYNKILDNLSFSTSYNFAADSLNWNPLSMQARTRLKGVTFNVRSSFDYYQYAMDDVTGREVTVNRFLSESGEGLMRMTSLNITAGADLNPQKRKKDYTPKTEAEELQLQQINQNIDNYVDFDIPWSLRLAYNYNWQKPFSEPTSQQSITAQGDLSLTEKWKVTWSNLGYDLTRKEPLGPQFGVIRDLHCWEFSFRYSPFGTRRGFQFSINAKASMLQDMKLSKQNDPTNR